MLNIGSLSIGGRVINKPEKLIKVIYHNKTNILI